MKRDMKTLLYAASIALLATACANDENHQETVDITKPIDLRLTPAPAATADTKAAIGATAFDADDKVGLFLAWEEGAEAQVAIANSIEQNRQWQNGAIIDGESLYWQNTADVHTIYAYYPHNTDLPAGSYTLPVGIEADQQAAGKDGFETADVLWGLYSGQAKNSVNIAMGHCMSQVTVQLTGGDGYTSGADVPEIAKVELSCPEGFIIAGQLSLNNGKVIANSADATYTTLTAYNDAANNIHRAILVPGQAVKKGTDFIRITTTDGTTYTYTYDEAEDLAISANHVYAFSLQLNKAGITLAEGGLTISPWGPTTNLDGDANMDIQ